MKVPWQRKEEQQKAFELAKRQLTTNRILVHYDPRKTTFQACDASPFGVGAVISHKFENEEEKPTAFASRCLASTEKKYSQP